MTVTGFFPKICEIQRESLSDNIVPSCQYKIRKNVNFVYTEALAAICYSSLISAVPTNQRHLKEKKHEA